MAHNVDVNRDISLHHERKSQWDNSVIRSLSHRNSKTLRSRLCKNANEEAELKTQQRHVTIPVSRNHSGIDSESRSGHILSVPIRFTMDSGGLSDSFWIGLKPTEGLKPTLRPSIPRFPPKRRPTSRRRQKQLRQCSAWSVNPIYVDGITQLISFALHGNDSSIFVDHWNSPWIFVHLYPLYFLNLNLTDLTTYF